jgi:hypothetical protein
MNYLTEYYKNQCNLLQERFNFLQETLLNIREDISGMSDAQIEDWIKGQDKGYMNKDQADSMREMLKRKRAKDRAAKGETKAPKGEPKGPGAEGTKPPPSGSAGSGTKPPPYERAYDPYREYNQRARERADQRARERASREEARAAKGGSKGPGAAPEAPTGSSRGVNSTASTVGRVVKGGAKQVAKLVTIPAEVVTSTVKSLNPVKKIPGGVRVNWGGVQRIGGLGAGIGGMIGAEAALDAVGIKDQSWANAVRVPVSYAAGGAADVVGTALFAGTLPSAAAVGSAAAGGAALGAMGYGSYKLGEYIGDKTGLHDAVGNALGGASELNTAKTGLRGGVPGINIKNDAEDAEEESRLKRARDIEAKANKMSGKPTLVPAGKMEYDDDNLPDEFFSSPEEAAAYRNQRAK